MLHNKLMAWLLAITLCVMSMVPSVYATTDETTLPDGYVPTHRYYLYVRDYNPGGCFGRVLTFFESDTPFIGSFNPDITVDNGRFGVVVVKGDSDVYFRRYNGGCAYGDGYASPSTGLVSTSAFFAYDVSYPMHVVKSNFDIKDSAGNVVIKGDLPNPNQPPTVETGDLGAILGGVWETIAPIVAVIVVAGLLIVSVIFLVRLVMRLVASYLR